MMPRRLKANAQADGAYVRQSDPFVGGAEVIQEALREVDISRTPLYTFRIDWEKRLLCGGRLQ